MSKNTRRTDRERLKYGICLNDECSKCKSKEIQAVPMRKDLICSECGKELRECPPPKKKGMSPMVLAIAAVVVLGGGAAALFLLPDKEPEMEVPEMEEVVAEPVVEDTVAVEEPVVEEPVVKQEPAQPKKVVNAVGKFSGKMLNNYPHGMGTYTFLKSRRIDAHDEKERVASAGDYIIGEWDNGHLIQGRWYDCNNNLKETIVLGKTMNPQKDHSLGQCTE